MSYGIDTIKVGVEISPSDLDLDGWKHSSRGVVKGDCEDVFDEVYYKEIELPNGAKIKLKFVPKSYKHNIFNVLFIEFSLPKLIFGVNYKDIDDYDEAFRIANSIIASIPGLPPLPDIRDVTPYRLDVCANLSVGEDNVHDHIKALENGYYPHRKRVVYDNDTVMFKSKEISTSVYNKASECHCHEASGILRYEIQVRNRWKLGELIGKKQPTLRDITKDVVKQILLKDMGILHLDGHIVGNAESLKAIIHNAFSPTKAQSLLDYLEVRRTMTVQEMKRRGYTSRRIAYYEKELKQVGLSSLSLEGEKTLPALTLLLGEDAKIGNDLPSVTLGVEGDEPVNLANLRRRPQPKYTARRTEWKKEKERSDRRPRTP